jgi:hypothetical protein
MLSGLCVTGQNSLSTKVFYKHTQTCHFVGTTEEDFVTEFFNDSTVKITEYSSNYRDEYNSILRVSYSGTYKIKGDTLTIKYLKHNSEAKSRIKKISADFDEKHHTILWFIHPKFLFSEIIQFKVLIDCFRY